MKFPKIKKPNIELPDFKKPDIKLPKSEFKISEGNMMKLWTMGSIICLGCSGIALIIALF